jgi:hypothetical protein
MENLRKALIAVKHGMSLRNAEKKYGVPKSTLEAQKMKSKERKQVDSVQSQKKWRM